MLVKIDTYFKEFLADYIVKQQEKGIKPLDITTDIAQMFVERGFDEAESAKIAVTVMLEIVTKIKEL